MRTAKVQASLRIRAVSPEPPLLAHTNSEKGGTFRRKARSLAPLNGWACAVKICHDGMLDDTNSLDSAQLHYLVHPYSTAVQCHKFHHFDSSSHMSCRKDVEDILFFQCKIEFYFTEGTPKAVFSRVKAAVALSENTSKVFMREIKFDLTLQRV